jgi:hypothetical protein
MSNAILAELSIHFKQNDVIIREKSITDNEPEQVIIIPASVAVNIAFQILDTYKVLTLKEIQQRHDSTTQQDIKDMVKNLMDKITARNNGKNK